MLIIPSIVFKRRVVVVVVVGPASTGFSFCHFTEFPSVSSTTHVSAQCVLNGSKVSELLRNDNA
jgi:hypothetical protein